MQTVMKKKKIINEARGRYRRDSYHTHAHAHACIHALTHAYYYYSVILSLLLLFYHITITCRG